MTVYRHRKADTFEVFYVGISLDKRRPYRISNRSLFWKRIESIHGRVVEIIAEGLSIEDARELESFLISEYGRRDLNEGSLANMTDGGEGRFGSKNSKESIIKMINNLKGTKHSIETKNKVSKSQSGGNNNLAKRVICTVTKNEWSCIKEVAEFIGMKKTTLRAMLCGQNKNKTTLKLNIN